MYLSVRNHHQQYVQQQLAQAHQLGSGVMVSQARATGAVMVPASAVIAPQQTLYQQRTQLEVTGAELLNFEQSESASSALWTSGAVSTHQPGQLVVGTVRSLGGSGALRAVSLSSQRPQQQQQPPLYARQPQIISGTPVAQVTSRFRLNRPGTSNPSKQMIKKNISFVSCFLYST